LITLYHGSGAQDFEVLGNTLDDNEHEALMLNVRQMLRARGEDGAVDFLERFPFRVKEGTNSFNDPFYVLIAHVPLSEYETFRTIAYQPKVKSGFQQIADVVTELGHYIRFIAVDLKRMSPERWDVFICHASDDKENVVEPIFHHLDSAGIRCWYDRGEIMWGDSVVGKINEGLRSSRFVIVVVSPALLKKAWATREMNAALSQEIDSGETRVLPLVVGTDDELRQITAQLVIQRDKRYLRWRGDPREIETELRALIRRENAKGTS
jgi:hypothetical protein